MTQLREDVAGHADDQWWSLVYRCSSDWWVRGVYVEHHGPSGTADTSRSQTRNENRDHG